MLMHHHFHSLMIFKICQFQVLASIPWKLAKCALPHLSFNSSPSSSRTEPSLRRCQLCQGWHIFTKSSIKVLFWEVFLQKSTRKELKTHVCMYSTWKEKKSEGSHNTWKREMYYAFFTNIINLGVLRINSLISLIWMNY